VAVNSCPLWLTYGIQKFHKFCSSNPESGDLDANRILAVIFNPRHAAASGYSQVAEEVKRQVETKQILGNLEGFDPMAV